MGELTEQTEQQLLELRAAVDRELQRRDKSAVNLRDPEVMRSVCQAVEESLDSFDGEAVPNEEIVKIRLFQYLSRILGIGTPQLLDRASVPQKMLPVQAEWNWANRNGKFVGCKTDLLVLDTSSTHFKPNSEYLKKGTYYSIGDTFIFETKHWHYPDVKKGIKKLKVGEYSRESPPSDLNNWKAEPWKSRKSVAIWDVCYDLLKITTTQKTVTDGAEESPSPFLPAFFVVYSTVDDAVNLWDAVLDRVKTEAEACGDLTPLRAYLRTPKHRRRWPAAVLEDWQLQRDV